MLNDILKGEWGFDGVVITDWGGCNNTDQAITNGLDMEFGSWTNGLTFGTSNAYDNYYMAKPYFEKILKGEYTDKELNEKARRVLRLIFRTSMDRNRGYGSLCSDEHYAAARRIGDDGIVLLKNDGNVLPIPQNKPLSILVVGENAIKMMTVGGGSSSLKVQHEVLPIDGLRAALTNATIDFERGYVGDVTGEYNGVVSGQDLSEKRSADQLIADAVSKAKSADYVIFVGGLNKSDGQDAEGADREGLELPYDQDAVIEALAKANKNLVVVNVSGNAVAMPWVKQVPAIVQAWYLGSEAGNALADILSGKVNPSGKLPMTFPVKLNDVGAHALGEYPGVKRENEEIWDEHYNEGLLVGYRWFDTKKIKPLFPFGFGLSYTTFSYGKPEFVGSKELTADGKITVAIPVTNTGSREGSEVVQLYISDQKAPVERPVKELKGFRKVTLQPGETQTVTFEITPADLAYFDADAHAWTTHPGSYKALLGSSSASVAPLSFQLK
jgi:beta-glucosidase